MSEGIKRRFEGIWIPAEIWLDDRLSVTEKFLLVEIERLDQGTGCKETNEHFSEYLGLSIRRVGAGISSLVSKGYIKRVLNQETGNERALYKNKKGEVK